MRENEFDYSEELEITLDQRLLSLFDIDTSPERKTPCGVEIMHFTCDMTVAHGGEVGVLELASEFITRKIICQVVEAMVESGSSETPFEDYVLFAPLPYRQKGEAWDERTSVETVQVKKGEKVGTIYFAPASKFSTPPPESKMGYAFMYNDGEALEAMCETNLMVAIEKPENIFVSKRT